MKKEVLITIVLAILVLVSLVQALQLRGLKGQIETGGFSVQTKAATTPVATGSSGSSGSGGALPQSLDNLPQMVGGC